MEKKKKKGKGRRIVLYIFLIIIILGAVLGWLLFGPTVSAPPGKYLYIRTGATYEDVKDSLLKNKVISETIAFDKLAKSFKYDKNVKPGRYKISQGMNVVNLVRMLKNGTQSPVNLLITKLRTKEDLAKKLSENFEFDYAEALSFLNNKDSLSKYELDTNTVMTAIIPNTYTMNWNNTPSKVFNKLYREEDKFWNKERKDKAARLHLSPAEVYTLASIVEEETTKQDDKGKIASVYLNRMHKGMTLAADPTVKYAMRNFGLKRILYGHLAYQSPYNTYLNKGLPPGPICTPSIKTIEAVLDQPETDYLFFVAKPELSGYSVFSTTYAEHEKHAKIYQKFLDSIGVK
jgi:UPF0755 protein